LDNAIRDIPIGARMKTHPLYGVALAAIGALVLTPDTLFMRWSGMDTFPMLAWRGLLMGGALLTVWLLLARERSWAELRSVFSWAGAIVVGLQALNAVLFNAGIATAPVSVVLFGVATAPVFSAIAAYLIGGERVAMATIITILLVLAGIGIAVLGPGHGGISLDQRSLLGALAGLAVAVAFAISFTVMRNHTELAILPTIGLGAMLAGTTGLLLTGIPAMKDGDVWAIAVSGAIILPVSFFLLTLATRHTHPSNVSLLLLLETVLGPAWVWWGVGERPTVPMIIGGAIVVISLTGYILHMRRVTPA
jgi:drug/metabolite transporter (DMT)-like permease